MLVNSIKTKNNFHNYIVIKQSDNTSAIEILLCGANGSILSDLNQSCTLTILDEVDQLIRQKTKEQIVNGTLTFRVTNDLKTNPHTLEITTSDGQKFPSNHDFKIFVSYTHDESELKVINNLSRDEALAEIDQSVKSFITNNTEDFIDKVATSKWLYENNFKPKEAVASFTDLPIPAELKELRGVTDENAVYIYDGAKWIKQSQLNFDGLADVRSRAEETENVINIIHHGAVGDGITDNYIVMQACIALAETTGRSLFIPAGQFYTSQTLRTSHMTTGLYTKGIRIFGTGKYSIIKGMNGDRTKTLDLSVNDNISGQATLAIHGSNNIIENLMFRDGICGIYIGQKPGETTRSSCSFNRFNNIAFEYNGTSVKFFHGSGNHYNTFNNITILHGQIGIHLGNGYYINDVNNNNRNTFNNVRVSRVYIGTLINSLGGDGNVFNNYYGEGVKPGAAIGNYPTSLVPTDLNGKNCAFVDVGGEVNKINCFMTEDCEMDIYSNGYNNQFTNVTAGDRLATDKRVILKRTLSYLGGSQEMLGMIYQLNDGAISSDRAGIYVKSPFRLFDSGYGRANNTVVEASAQFKTVTSNSMSSSSRLSKKVNWCTNISFALNTSVQTTTSSEVLKIKLPYQDKPENVYIRNNWTTMTKPFDAYVSNNNSGNLERVIARFSTQAEADSYGGFHVVIPAPSYGWSTSVNNFVTFDLSYYVV